MLQRTFPAGFIAPLHEIKVAK
jgi:hypothetical protein